MEREQARCNTLIDALVERNGGAVNDHAGDGVCAIFQTGDPLRCALDIQREVEAAHWSGVGELRLRIGVHVGWDATHGAGKARASRITECAWGGQIIVSAAAAHAYGLPAGCEWTDFGFCRLRGVAEPIRLLGLLHPALARRAFPPLRTPLEGGFVPAPRAPIHGRDEELEEIVRNLTRGARALTIVGPGGNGKTSLVIEVARTLSETRAVYFESLEGKADKTDVTAAVAKALRFPFYGAASQEEQLIAYLRDRAAVIVLDNADRLAGKCAFLEGMLAACPEVRILVTSREPLLFEGERVIRLRGLKSPSKDDPDFRSAPVCALFIQEARANEPEFDLEDHEAGIFCEICEILGGSPLALRWAAQWTHLLSVSEIRAELRRGGVTFLGGLVGDGEGLGPERVFERSWTLLGDDLRRALARLSVFDGGFDKDAAHAVAGADVTDLGVLERKSLLEACGNGRFVMHPLARENARERLARAPGDLASETRRLHSEYFLSMVRRCYLEGRGAEQARMLDRVETELANLCAGWAYAVEVNDVVRIREAIEPMFYMFAHRGLYHDCARLLDAQIDDAALRAHFLGIRANCLMHQGAYPIGEALARRALDGGACEPIAAAHCHHALATIAHARGDYSIARTHYEDALAERTRIADEMGSYYSVMSLAFLELLQNNVAKARERAKESHRLCLSTGHLGGMLSVHACAGDIAAREGREADAEESYRQAIEVAEIVRNPQLEAATLLKLGAICSNRGELGLARARFENALDLAEAIGDTRIAINARLGLGHVLRIKAKPHRAKAVLRKALEQAYALSSQAQLAEALYELACVARDSGDCRAAAHITNVLHCLDYERMKTECADLIREFIGPRAPARVNVDAALLELINEPEFGVVRL
jgi:predicted ATPase